MYCVGIYIYMCIYIYVYLFVCIYIYIYRCILSKWIQVSSGGSKWSQINQVSAVNEEKVNLSEATSVQVNSTGVNAYLFYLIQMRSSEPRWDPSGLTWIHLDISLGFTLIHMDSLGLIWSHLDCLGPLRSTWAHLNSFG